MASLNNQVLNMYVLSFTYISLLLFLLNNVNGHLYDYNYNVKQYTRQIVLKQGKLQGVIVEPKVNRDLPPVEQYLGIPYAAAPVGELRFMPPGSAPQWYGVKIADNFGPVCPQQFPDTKNMAPERKEYFKRLVKFLSKQDEDCLYLNIYAPVQDSGRVIGKYPVIVFLHGESFEWNSGNPYDGSVLAAYGKVVFVTFNFRLGILGFLRVGLKDTAKTNFGLVDQVAALLWVKENIAAFGGDPSSVTLLGHGTGAAAASLLMLSPMVEQEGSKLLFHRAILMSGTSLSDWALASRTSKQVTYQIADSLNCEMDDEKFAACLRKKRLNEIMTATATIGKFGTKFGPLVDGLIVPNDPSYLMANYTNLLHRFVLLYGITEIESINLLDAVALTHGMLEKERDEDLNKYLSIRCELNHEVCLLRTLAEYIGKDFVTNDQSSGGFATRDMLLDMLSDARTVGPMILTARYHATVNPQSYFYVFGHTTSSRNFIYNKTIHGDELPYVLGIPLDSPKTHFVDHYSEHERLLSEVIMTYWCNFAHTGNPNIPAKHSYLSLRPSQWQDFDVEWPEFELKHEAYLYLDTPPTIKYHYRSKQVNFWTKTIPEIAYNRTLEFNKLQYMKSTQTPNIQYAKNVPPFIYPKPISKYSVGKNNYVKPNKYPVSVSEETNNNKVYGIVHYKADEDNASREKMLSNMEYGKIKTKEPEIKSGTTMNVLIAVGAVFLLVNVILFVGLYYKCIRLKSVESNRKRDCEEPEISETSSSKRQKFDGGCNLMKMISKSSKSEDTYEAVKTSEGSSKTKLTRQMSASTIDPHTKVRDWIANEIVNKYSPRIFRSAKRPFMLTRQFSTIRKEVEEIKESNPKIYESNSTLGKSPTRPVSPVEDKVFLKSIIKKKPEKVSVAVDATPSGRGPSVLMQQPIELTKSLDYPNFHPEFEASSLRRSATLDNFLNPRKSQTFRRSSTSINLEIQPIETIKIEHHHSRSEPVQDLYDELNKNRPKTLKTFSQDVNVTSRDDDDDEIKPLTPEESLMTIKRRNFPKVLPDFPETKQSLAHKRRSMPAPNVLYRPIHDTFSNSQPNSPSGKIYARFPPTPPPRTSSTLGRKTGIGCQSPALLASEPPSPSEPELTCNNLYVGPLIPHAYKLNTQPIYDNLRAPKENDIKDKGIPKAIITADQNNPVRRLEPKIIIKPTMTRTLSDPHKNKSIPRVCVNDNLSPITTIRHIDNNNINNKNEPDIIIKTERCETNDENNKIKSDNNTTIKDVIVEHENEQQQQQKQQEVQRTGEIPNEIVDVDGGEKSNKTSTTVKNSNTSLNKEFSTSSESSPSEESDTGTVVKRV